MKEQLSIYVLTKLLQSLVYRFYEVGMTDEFYDPLSDPRVIEANKALHDPLTTWAGQEYKLLCDLSRAATSFLKTGKQTKLEDAVESLRKFRINE